MIDTTCCPEELIDGYAQRLKVCGHLLRLKTFGLIEKQDACVPDLRQCLNQPQPVINRHLAVLKDKGIVESSTEGNRRIYRITDDFVRNVISKF